MKISKIVYLFVAVAVITLFAAANHPAKEIEAGTQQPANFCAQIQKTLEMGYLLYLPDDYGKKDKDWPLVLFLHGSGERGTDIELVKRHGPPKLIENGQKFDFLVVSPQCPRKQWWDVDTLANLVDDIIKRYDVDEDRIYCTGLSMGGYGTWEMAIKYPHKFAAIAPICGDSFETRAGEIRHIPAWVAHGGQDKGVNPRGSVAMVQTLQKYGGEVVFKYFPNGGHDVWTRTYDDPEFFAWLLKHKRQEVSKAEKP